MADTIHVLVVRVSDVRCAIPMDHVEQTFRLGDHRIHQVGGTEAVLFRNRSLQTYRMRVVLGLGDDGTTPPAGVIAWLGGRRIVLGVDELVGQFDLAKVPLPVLAASPFFLGACILGDGEIVPVIDPPMLVGGGLDSVEFGLTPMQASALREIGNIGAGHAATALSLMIGRPVDISWAESLIVPAGRASEHTGSPLQTSVGVTVPLANNDGSVALLLARDAAENLAASMGTSFDEPLGRSAIMELGNVLTCSYLAAVLELTGLEMEPEPPQLQVDLLGALLEGGVFGGADLDKAPLLLIRSTLTVEGDHGCGVLFAPRLRDITGLLRRLELALAA